MSDGLDEIRKDAYGAISEWDCFMNDFTRLREDPNGARAKLDEFILLLAARNVADDVLSSTKSSPTLEELASEIESDIMLDIGYLDEVGCPIERQYKIYEAQEMVRVAKNVREMLKEDTQ